MLSSTTMQGDEWKVARSEKDEQETRETSAKPEDPKDETKASEAHSHTQDIKAFFGESKTTANTETTNSVADKNVISALMSQNKKLKEALRKRDLKIEALEAEAASFRQAFGTELRSRLQLLAEAARTPGIDGGRTDGTDRTGTRADKLISTPEGGMRGCSGSPESVDAELMTALADSLNAEIMLAFADHGQSYALDAF